MAKTKYKDPYIHPQATVIGMVTFGKHCSVWPSAVVRADMNTIELGDYVNVQDNSTLHVDARGGITVGAYTLIGHHAMLHSCSIGKGVLIGIGATVLEGAEIGDGAMITAGCLIRGGTKIPPMAMVIQKDGKQVVYENKARPLLAVAGCIEYAHLCKVHQDEEFRVFTPDDEKEIMAEAKEVIAQWGLGR